jgi:hypothetical protein
MERAVELAHIATAGNDGISAECDARSHVTRHEYGLWKKSRALGASFRAKQQEYNKAKIRLSIRRRAMSKPAFLSIVLLACVLSSGAQMKDVYIPGVPAQPAPMDRDHGKPVPDEPKLQHHIDLVKLQQEADDLARTAQTIPTDVAGVRQGTLPKDMIDKLKRIEKLSKRLRSELNP